MTKIFINGRAYDGIGQMPPEVREQYLQALKSMEIADPEILPASSLNTGSSNLEVKESVFYNGREYKSRDELPSEIRDMLDHMSQAKTGERETHVEIKTAKTFAPHVRVSQARLFDHKSRRLVNAPFSVWSLAAVLVVITFFLLFLWLARVKPSSFWRH